MLAGVTELRSAQSTILLRIQHQTHPHSPVV